MFKNILVLGGRGFIGFNAIQKWKQQYSEVNFISIDAYTYADQFMIDEKNKWFNNHEIPFYVVDLSLDTAEK